MKTITVSALALSIAAFGVSAYAAPAARPNATHHRLRRGGKKKMKKVEGEAWARAISARPR